MERWEYLAIERQGGSGRAVQRFDRVDSAPDDAQVAGWPPTFAACVFRAALEGWELVAAVSSEPYRQTWVFKRPARGHRRDQETL